MVRGGDDVMRRGQGFVPQRGKDRHRNPRRCESTKPINNRNTKHAQVRRYGEIYMPDKPKSRTDRYTQHMSATTRRSPT